VSPAMLKGMNTEIYGEGHPFGDPSWYQAYNTPYYNDTHKQLLTQVVSWRPRLPLPPSAKL